MRLPKINTSVNKHIYAIGAYKGKLVLVVLVRTLVEVPGYISRQLFMVPSNTSVLPYTSTSPSVLTAIDKSC